MKRILAVAMGLLVITGCEERRASPRETDAYMHAGDGPTNVGMVPGSGRVDTGGGVTKGDPPSKVESAVTATATYEEPRTNTSGR